MLGAGSLGRSSRVCSVLCIRFRSSVETNKATADTRCTEPHHGASSTPCDRLGRDMLEALGSALYLKVARRPEKTQVAMASQAAKVLRADQQEGGETANRKRRCSEQSASRAGEDEYR